MSSLSYACGNFFVVFISLFELRSSKSTSSFSISASYDGFTGKVLSLTTIVDSVIIARP